MLRVFFGHHKCASRAVRAILGAEAARRGARHWTYDDFLTDGSPPLVFWSLPGIDDPIRLSDIPDGDFVSYINATPGRLDELHRSGRDFRAVEVIRDPRNVLVSSYEHHKDGHPFLTDLWRWPLLEAVQPALRLLDREAGLRLEMNTIFREVATKQFSLSTAGHADVEVLRVEQLATDRQAFLSGLAASLELDTVVDEKPPAADPRTYRTVDPEAWKSSLPEAVLSDFVDCYGSLTTNMGYQLDAAPLKVS